MTGGLRELLGLPELSPDAASRTGEFGQEFRSGMAGLNENMQLLAAQAGQAEHQSLNSQRDKLIAAYQTAAAVGDPSAKQRVIAAAGKVKESAASKVTVAATGRETWQQREPDFDDALLKIGELEDSSHPKAATYRQLGDAIRSRANNRDYQQATSALDQLLPKLDQAHILYIGEPEGFNEAPGEGGGSSNSSKPAAVPKGADTVDSNRPNSSSSSSKPAVVPKGADTAGSNVSGGSSSSGGTVGTTGNPSSSGQGKQPDTATLGLRVQGTGKNWPDSTIVTIQTVNGPEKMSVDDYRWKRHLANNWVHEQMQNYLVQVEKNRGGLKSGDQGAYRQEAAKRFGLDANWATQTHVPGTKANVGLPYGTDPRLVPDHIKYGVPKATDPPAKVGTGAAKSGVDPHGQTQPAQPQTGNRAAPQAGHTPAKGGDIGNADTVDPKGKTQPAQRPTGPAAPQPSVSPANEKAIAEMSAAAEEAKTLAKSGNPADIEKARQKLATVEKQAEVVAKSIKPDAPGQEPTTAKNFARDAKSTALKASGIAVKFLAAYAIIETVRNILDSKSISEGLEKTSQIAKGHAKEAAKVGALILMTGGRKVVGTALSILLQTSEETDKQTRNRIFMDGVAELMNQVRPGSAYIIKGQQSPIIYDQELYAEVSKQVKQKRIEYLEDDVVKIGHQDGLVGAPFKKKFEVSDVDEEDLGISSKTMETAYFRGYGRGEIQRKVKVPDRVRYEGYKDALEGKPSNFEPLKEWPEIRELLSRLNNRSISNEEYNEYNRLLNSYGDSYQDGYERGKKAATQRTLQRIELTPGKNFSANQHSSTPLTAFAVYSEGPKDEISSKDIWSSSDPKTVEFSRQGEHIHALMKGPGKSTITARYQHGGITKEASLTIEVAEVKEPDPAVYAAVDKRAFEVDEEMPFLTTIRNAEWTVLPANAVSKSALDPRDLSIYGSTMGAKDGVLLTMLKAGKLTITVTSKTDNKVKAKTEITVGPKKK